MRELREFVRDSGATVQHFVWDVTMVRVFRRFVELGSGAGGGAATAVNSSGAEAAISYLGDLGAFELTPAHMLRSTSTVPPPLTENVVTAKGVEVNGKGLEWRAEQLLCFAERGLGDHSAETVQAAVASLRGLLACKNTQVLNASSRRVNNELDPFRGGGKNPHSDLAQRTSETFSQLLWCNFDGGYDVWLRRIVRGLLLFNRRTDGVLWATHPLCAANTEFCEFVLPHALFEILRDDVGEDSFATQEFSKGVTAFFTEALARADSVPLRCVRCVINAMNVLRTFDKNMGRPWKRAGSREWLAVDLLLVAKVSARYALPSVTVNQLCTACTCV
jgi:hypothetical protein